MNKRSVSPDSQHREHANPATERISQRETSCTRHTCLFSLLPSGRRLGGLDPGQVQPTEGQLHPQAVRKLISPLPSLCCSPLRTSRCRGLLVILCMCGTCRRSDRTTFYFMDWGTNFNKSLTRAEEVGPQGKFCGFLMISCWYYNWLQPHSNVKWAWRKTQIVYLSLCPEFRRSTYWVWWSR